VRIDVWSDIVCPWCYIGKRRFERGLSLLDSPPAVEFVHRAFQLNPGAPRDKTSSRRAYLMAKYGWSAPQTDAMDARMHQVAAAEGLDYHLAGTSTGNTFDAHRVIHFARSKGLEDAALERLYRAYFTEQRSIFDHESLAALAADAGLDRDETARMLAGDAFADAVRADLEDAATLHVSGVPFFVINNRFSISGAQSADIFAEAIRRAR
jgi:predicted DsbA family dithiol-disulfide isomerase